MFSIISFRPSKPGKLVDLEEPIADGGFIYKKVFRADPSSNIENPLRPARNKECKSASDVLKEYFVFVNVSKTAL